MGRFTGFICDRQSCGCTAEGSGREGNGTPIGWISVTISVEGQADGTRVYCSNNCVAILFAERAGLEFKTKPTGGRGKARTISEEGRATLVENGRRTGLISGHKRGSHDTEPEPDCPLCDRETAA